MKAARQRALADLLHDRDVTSQAQLLARLRDRGFEATQATVSRDLEDLGAVKVRGSNGQLVYALQEDSGDVVDEDELRRALSFSMLTAAPSGNLIVVRTPPGHAQALASTLDRSGLPSLLGTVAGDDTVLLVCDERTSSRTLARRLRGLAEPLPGPSPLRTVQPAGVPSGTAHRRRTADALTGQRRPRRPDSGRIRIDPGAVG